MAAALRLALAAAVRMVDRVHGGPAHGRALSAPAAAAGLPPRDVLVVDVSDLTDRGLEEQDLRSAWFTRAEVERMIRDGAFTDAKSVAAYTLLLLGEVSQG